MKSFLQAVTVTVVLLAPALAAQESFTVTADPTPLAYFVDGDEHPELTLERGVTYEFDVSGVDQIHPFWITQDETGGPGTPPWETGVTNNGATGSSGNTIVTFEVPGDAPDELYYQCGSHANMGGMLNIVGTSDTEVDPSAGFDLSVVSQNPGASRVTVGLALAEPSDVSVEVFDIRGRRVDVLHEGALAAGGDHHFEVGQNLRPGVYVVRATDGERMAELNVTIAR